MRPDVWILLFLCASVFAKPTQEDDSLYTIEIERSLNKKIYHNKSVELHYNASETIKITFIRSWAVGVPPFMKLYWVEGNEKKMIDEITHNFTRQFSLRLKSESNDCRLQCEIHFNNTMKTLEVHFLKILNPSEEIIQNTGNLFKIILISLGAFIAISILIMIVVAVYKHFKNKSTTRFSATAYPEYSEIIPMYKIKNRPKNIDDNAPNIQKDVVNISQKITDTHENMTKPYLT